MVIRGKKIDTQTHTPTHTPTHTHARTQKPYIIFKATTAIFISPPQSLSSTTEDAGGGEKM